MQLYHVFQGLQAIKEKKGSLNNSDRKQLTLAQELLAQELSLALGTDEEVMKEKLEEIASTEETAA